jgi:hypothetical protein
MNPRTLPTYNVVYTNHVTLEGNNHAHGIAMADWTEVIEEIRSGPQEAVRRAFEEGGDAVVFVIVKGQSVPLPYKKGENLEGLLSQLRLILG